MLLLCHFPLFDYDSIRASLKYYEQFAALIVTSLISKFCRLFFPSVQTIIKCLFFLCRLNFCFCLLFCSHLEHLFGELDLYIK